MTRPDDEDELTVKAALRGIVDVLKQITAIIAGCSAIGAGLWYMFGAHLAAIADLPEINAGFSRQLTLIQGDLDAMKQSMASKLRPVVEFHGRPEVKPERLVAPSRVYVAYHLRRNEGCTGTVVRRWWDATTGTYDPAFQTIFDVQRASITARFQLWRLPLDVPALPPGEWAYHPELIPGPDCVSDLPVVMPPAYFTVLPNE